MINTIHPKVDVAAIVFNENRVLLVKRGTEPSKGQWTFPGGKLLAGETLQHAAERETFEETTIKVSVKEIAHTFEIIEVDHNNKLQFHYIIIDMQATYLSGRPEARDDAAEARWVSNSEITSLKLNQETYNLLHEKYHFI